MVAEVKKDQLCSSLHVLAMNLSNSGFKEFKGIASGNVAGNKFLTPFTALVS